MSAATAADASRFGRASYSGNESNHYYPDGRREYMNGATLEGGYVRLIYDLTGNPIIDWTGDSKVWTYRVYGPGVDECLAEWRRPNNRITYQHHDALGSVTAVTLSYGSLAYRSTYKAFGQMTRGTYDLPTTQLGYTSRETSVAGLMQYRSRYYDPRMGGSHNGIRMRAIRCFRRRCIGISTEITARSITRIPLATIHY